jgi:branched-chain amino acid transport system permease protein
MRRDILIGLGLLVIPIVVSFTAGPYLLRLSTIVLMYTVLAMSWNFIGGMAGYPSFGTAAFFGLGAYTGAVVQTSGGSMYVAWAAAALLTIVVSGFLGWVLLRLRGHYFAIATFAVVEVFRVLTNSMTEVTGGGMGLNLPIPQMASVHAQAVFFFYMMLGLAAITFAVSLAVSYSKLGFGLRCIQQNEAAADILGINTTQQKVVAFMLASAFTAAAGAIYASWVYYIEPPDVFDIMYSVKPIVMVLLGGAGTVFGPIIGAVAYLSLEEIVWRNLLQVNTGALGVLIVLLVLYLPKGFLSVRFGRLWKRAAS